MTAYIRGVTAPFSWQLPYRWPRKPVLARNVVATSQPLAAQAGLQVMADGGNAVDAIVATAVTLTIVEPVSNGIGSDAFAIVWDGRQLHGLNASGRSPAAWTPEYFSGDAVPPLGWNSVTVPGAVSAWVALHGKFGRLPFTKLFESAIHYGRNGFLVSPTRFCATGGRRGPANFSRSPNTPRRWKRSRSPMVRLSTVGKSPRRWSRTPEPMAERCSPAILPIIGPIGWTRSQATTAATPCTRSRPTARASSR